MNCRDAYLSKFFMLNALFVLIVFLMQLNKDRLYLQWPLGMKYNITFVSKKLEVNIFITINILLSALINNVTHFLYLTRYYTNLNLTYIIDIVIIKIVKLNAKICG